MEEQKRIVEALLFAADFPLTITHIKGILGNEKVEKINEILSQLNIEYEREGKSFFIQEVGGGYILSTRPEYSRWVSELYKGRKPPILSQPALETLAIIAYRQPVSRPDIEQIRGVNSDSVIATLLERNLITVVGKAETVGRPILYGTTLQFLRYFGLNSLSALPTFSDLEASFMHLEEEMDES